MSYLFVSKSKQTDYLKCRVVVVTLLENHIGGGLSNIYSQATVWIEIKSHKAEIYKHMLHKLKKLSWDALPVWII